MALSREQFTELRKKGLSVDQIVNFERGNKPRMSGGQFTVPKPPENRQAKIAQYKQEAQKSAEEAKKANSFMGILGNTLKGIGGTLANSEVGLGQSIAKIIGVDSKTTQALQKTEEMSVTTQLNLLKRIREKETRGEDTTRLKQAYNQLVSDPARKEVQTQLKEAITMPTTGQVIGQLGGTALDILTAGTYSKAAGSAPSFSRFVQPGSKATTGVVASGLPELAPIARQKAGGLFTMKGAGNIATGAGIGYASDVTQGLQGARGEDRTGAKAFIPGMGTALGTALPVISETAQSVKNVKTGQGTVTKRRTALDDIEKRYSNVQKVFANADRKGVDVRSLLSETNLLNGAVDEDGLVSAGRALENFDEMVAPYEGKIRDAIQKEGAKVRISDLAGAMDDFVSKSTLESGAYQKLNNELLTDLKGLQAKYGDNIPVEALHDTKIFRGNASNYVDTGANVVNKEATRFFKEAVENNVRSMDVKNYNGELSKLYTVRDAIEALDKKRVKGGRMGKYFSSVIGTGIGASSGNPILAILGAEIGARTQGAILGRSFGGQLNKSMDIPESLINMANKKVSAQDIIPPVVIPKKIEPNTLNLQSKSLGSLKTSQANTSAPTKNVIPKTVLPVREVSSNGGGQGTSVIQSQSAIKRTTDTSDVVLRDQAKKYNVDYDSLNKTIDTKLSKAESWKKYADTEAEKIIQGVPDTKVAIAPIKSRQRILEKTLKEEEGNVENIKDIARNTIVPSTPEARATVLKRMDARKDIARRKDQRPEDFMGYEGTIYNIKTPDGQIVETQVVSPEMTFGKNLPEFSKSVLGEDVFNEIAKRTGLEPGLGHVYYEKLRTMSNAEMLSPEGQELIKKSFDYYSKLR